MLTQNNKCLFCFSVSSFCDNHFASIRLVDLVAFNMAMKTTIERTAYSISKPQEFLYKLNCPFRAFSLTPPVRLRQIYWNKSVYIRKELYSQRVGLVQQDDRRLMLPWRHVKTLYSFVTCYSILAQRRNRIIWNIFELDMIQKVAEII